MQFVAIFVVPDFLIVVAIAIKHYFSIPVVFFSRQEVARVIIYHRNDEMNTNTLYKANYAATDKAIKLAPVVGCLWDETFIGLPKDSKKT